MTAAEWRGGGTSSSSSSLKIGDTTPPTVPQGLTTESLGYRRVAISWQPSTDDGGGPIRYRLFRNGTRIATLRDDTSFVDRPAYAGTYRYKVRAVDAAGNKSTFSVVVRGYAIKGPL
jgi:chitinase